MTQASTPQSTHPIDIKALDLSDPKSNTDVRVAIANGSLEATRALVAFERQTHPLQNHVTELMHAAWHGHDQMIKDIMNTPGFDQSECNRQDKHGRTALVYSIAHGHTECFNILQAHTDMQITDERGMDVLMIATRSNKPEMVETLLEHVDARRQNQYGWSALMIACRNGNVECARHLIDRSDLSATNVDCNTAAHIAIRFGQAECLSLIVPKVDMSMLDHEGRSLLDFAKECRNVDSLEIIHTELIRQSALEQSRILDAHIVASAGHQANTPSRPSRPVCRL